MENKEYLEPVEIAPGIYWVGFADINASLHCNPYLIVEGDEAVLIDSGSRGDFSTVMLKVLRTGLDPHKIVRLIYHHYDPDLCGNLPHMEAVINNEDLKVISHRENNIFIHYYSPTPTKQCIENLGYQFSFKTGRRLDFIHTPYSHTPGNFITYDSLTKTLFTSDIFGSYDHNWDLYLPFTHECEHCTPQLNCKRTKRKCPLFGIMDFHKRVMTSKQSLHYALNLIEAMEVNLYAPQHGSLINSKPAIKTILKHLYSLEYVGFDHYLKENQDG